MFKAKETGSPLKAEEKSTYDKIRSKIAGATVFDNSRMSKTEFKAKILKEIASSVGIDLDKGGTDLKGLANLVRDKLAYMTFSAREWFFRLFKKGFISPHEKCSFSSRFFPAFPAWLSEFL